LPQPAHHAGSPPPLALGGRDARLAQAPADFADGAALLADPAEDLPHHGRLFFDDPVRRFAVAALPPADVAVAVGGATQDIGRAPPGGVQLAAAAALPDLCALVLGDHSLDLRQQVFLGRVSDRAVEEDDLNATALQLVEQQDLVGVFPCQAVRGVDVEAVDGPGGGLVAQALQRRAEEGAAAGRLIEEAQL